MIHFLCNWYHKRRVKKFNWIYTDKEKLLLKSMILEVAEKTVRQLLSNSIPPVEEHILKEKANGMLHPNDPVFRTRDFTPEGIHVALIDIKLVPLHVNDHNTGATVAAWRMKIGR